METITMNDTTPNQISRPAYSRNQQPHRPRQWRTALAAAFATALVGAALAHSTWAQNVPQLVNYQGRVANPGGVPLPTADYDLSFSVYDAATNGVLIWGPQVFDGQAAQGHGPRIPVVQGYFNTMLGPVDTGGRALADGFNGAVRFVEVTVSTNPPILPRQQILTVPFAFKAADSAKLAGYDWSVLFGTNSPGMGKIPFSKLEPRPAGSVVPAGGIAVSDPVSGNSISVTLPVSGTRPVVIMLIPGPYSAGPASYVKRAAEAHFYRNGTPIAINVGLARDGDGISGGLGYSAFSIPVIDVPSSAGTNQYSVSMPGAVVINVRMLAYELYQLR